jgi:peptide deformylase
MFLPIVAYGDPLLRKKGQPIDKDYPQLDTLLENMWETMYNSYGVGLAAPQIGKNIRLFLIDTAPFADNDDFPEEERKFLKTFKRVFINAQIIEEKGEEWAFSEGCLSVPNINEEVLRKPEVTIEYLDENFKKHKETFTGLAARVIQHEYDHTEGIIFTDKVSAFKKRLLKRKLEKISKGEVQVDYPMRFPKLKKRK